MPTLPADVRAALRLADGPASDEDDNRIAVDDLSDDTIAGFITESDATIGTYLSGKQVDPNLAAALSRDVAAYLLVLSYRGSDDFDDNDPVARRYRHAMSVAEDIGTGKVVPVLDDPTVPVVTVINQPLQPLTGTSIFGYPVILDQPPSYPGSW